ncbi:MAG: putative ATP /GTP binding protein [Candidatus Jettenia ecosi]|uniref:Putative ATP /GTP binding protein n=1 Tax=Candidatus Jettenia ecosi TaxID=2494326 RepID=A0A533QB27_9BACT|nr:MAG: putative ATP /GTP binding protein [Candidatus Jettenia ecosi]
MASLKIPKRISMALLNSLGAGVVPRVGLEYIAVGRKNETAAVLRDLANVAEGGAVFRFIVGRYGSGKSFMLQLLRNYAMERNFVVADADLSPERRLTGTNGQGVATYREMMKNLATKTRADGGALVSILERWISGIAAEVIKEAGISSNDGRFNDAVEAKIMEVVHNMEGMVHGFDFATVLSTYWRGHRLGNDDLKASALRWLRGEFTTKTEAHSALGVRVIIDDESWYDYIKILAKFVSDIGYKGLLVIIDEAVNLYKITNTVSRQNNYEKLLTVFNDTMQGKAERLGILMAGTPQFIEDSRRGLYSYEALRSRLAESRFVKDGLQDMAGPIIRLNVLTHEEIFVLLTRLSNVHTAHYGYENALKSEELQDFMQEIVNRLGAEELLTPREVVRDFITILNILFQNKEVSFSQLVHGVNFQPTKAGKDPEVDEDGKFAEISL